MPAVRKSMEPWIKDEVVYYEHQVEGIRKLARQKNFILADEMGLGKSLQAITVFAIDIVRGRCNTCIVVCPASLKINWEDEFTKFTGGIHIQVLDGTPTARKAQIVEFMLIPFPKVLIVNYEQVTAHLEEFNKIGFDVAIFDEAHYIKNPKSKRSKACLALRSKRSFMLTGTPLLNNVAELWTLFHRVNPTEPDFKGYWRFVNRFCNTPDAPIWMADGSFKPLGEIKVGDEVMGWTNEIDGRSRFIPSTVEATHLRVAPEVIQVTMESGQVVKCTPDHQWYAASHGREAHIWGSIGNAPDTPEYAKFRKQGKSLSSLSKVIVPTKSLTPEQKEEFDWLMGLYDGEGSKEYIAQSKDHNPEIYQKIQEVLNLVGIPFTPTDDKFKMLGGLQTYVNILNWNKTFVKRGWFEAKIRYSQRPKGSDGYFNYKGEGSRIPLQMNRYRDRIIEKKSLGPGKVISMQTSTGNYIAWGYASKNCALGGYTGHEVIGVKNEQILNTHLRNYMLRRRKNDVLDLPEVQIITKNVKMLPEQQKLYNEVITEMKLTQSDGSALDVENGMTKLLRLKQIMGTTLPFNGKDISAKFDLAEIEDEELVLSGEHIVVFTQFRDVNSAYAARLQAKGLPVFTMTGDDKPIDRPGIVKKWESAPPGVLICMFQVGGVGLNMTKARHGVFLDKLFVPGLNKQAIDRMHRIGADKTQAIQIRDYQIKNSAESRINEILKMKEATIDKTVDSDKTSNLEWHKRLIAAALQGD